MSSRFHNKWHRHNHHTYQRAGEPDSGHDPIASPLDPFLGDFILHGALTTVAPLSSFAGSFYSNYTGLSAFGGREGIYTSSLSGIGAHFYTPMVSGTGPFEDIDLIPSLSAKALLVDGYSQFNGPAWFHSIYS